MTEPILLRARGLKNSRALPTYVRLGGYIHVADWYLPKADVPVGAEKDGAAQHSGLGTQLLETAETIAKEQGFMKIAVISAIGTRKYYLERGFERGTLYLVKSL